MTLSNTSSNNPATTTPAAPLPATSLRNGSVVDLEDMDLLVNGYIRRLPPIPPLSLVIKRHQLGIQSIEQCPDPMLVRWLNEVKAVAPGVLEREQASCLLTVPLVTHSQVHYIGLSVGLLEVEWAAGFSGEQTIPTSAKAWCWSIRAVEEGTAWQDLVTMWAIAQLYDIPPAKVQLNVICLGSSGPAAVLKLQQDHTQHQLTTAWLKQVLAGKPGPHPALVEEVDVLEEDLSDLLDFDAMPEVAIDGIEQAAAW